ncbi:hypothetical protein QR680_005153 [Steinernema hermaphroditum]|uniref:Uncharacterized protein n=1 Tax=Steinernema hermaphroditum TaxID=289476 RepID=A0AA39HSF8_9BILA|nr:hypothetical protein QR680_005153 [Steinernema hermaphroditum]
MNQNHQPIKIEDGESPATELRCNEQIERCKSPDLWPEPVPGAWEYTRDLSSIAPGSKQDRTANRFKTDLDPEDVRLVNELGQLTPDQLMKYVKNLQNNTFVLGQEEAYQFSRGKILSIFEK